MAETGPIMPPGMGVISGRDPRNHDEPFVNQVHIGITGGAGTPVTDGFLSIIHVGNAGLCRIDTLEVDELHYPILLKSRRLVPDTEGPGTFRGAPSIYAEFGPVDDCTMKVLYTADGTINTAQGARGGGSGSPCRALKRETDGSETVLPACYGVTLKPGEMVISQSSGGGGYGSPLERDPARVLHDLREGWISATRAADVYGVVTVGSADDDTLAIDAPATTRRRASLRQPKGK
jgi:N-methylhydantoinase B